MPKLTPKQQQALAWFVGQYNLIPQLSSYPNYRFTVRDQNKERIHHISHIVTQYDRREK